MMRKFNSLMTMFAKPLSASSSDEVTGQKQGNSPVDQGETPPSEKVPVAFDERKVLEAYDLVEVELHSPTFDIDYAHFVNCDDFPDETGCELVLAGMVAEHICEKLGLSRTETKEVVCRIKMMYLDVIRSLEKDAVDAAKRKQDLSAQTKKSNWLSRLRSKTNFPPQRTSFEDFCKRTDQRKNASEAAPDERVRSTRRIKEKMSRIRKRFKALPSLTKRLDGALVGAAKFNYPGSELYDAVIRDDRLQVVAHDNDGNWLLVKSLSSGDLSFVPAHLVDLDIAGDMSLKKALKRFQIPTRFDFSQWEESQLMNGDPETNPSTYGFREKCRSLSEKLFARKVSARKHRTQTPDCKAKPRKRAPWFKSSTVNKEAVNVMETSECGPHESQNDRLNSELNVCQKETWKLRVTSIFKKDQTTEASFLKGLNGKVGKALEKAKTLSLKPKKRWVVKALIRRTFN